MLCAKFGWIWSSSSGEYFKFHQCVFAIPLISPLRNGCGPSFEQNLNPLYPWRLCAKFYWNWHIGSGEEDFCNFVNVFSAFRHYLPMERACSSFEHWRTDRRRTPGSVRKVHLSFQLMWAKKHYQCVFLMILFRLSYSWSPVFNRSSSPDLKSSYSISLTIKLPLDDFPTLFDFHHVVQTRVRIPRRKNFPQWN